jgi:hypothetical protein
MSPSGRLEGDFTSLPFEAPAVSLRTPSPRHLQIWLQLRELRVRALHAKLESSRRGRDRAVLACQQQQADLAMLLEQRRAVRAWCAGPGSGTGPAGMALTVAHDRLLAAREERAEYAAIDLERQRLQAERVLVEARAHWLQALRQQQAARRWLADWQGRYAAQAADAAEAEAADAHSASRPAAGEVSGGLGW